MARPLPTIDPRIAGMSKKEVKDFVNSQGFFHHFNIQKFDNEYEGDPNAVKITAIASNGDLNRNGYKIEPEAFINSWEIYKENPVILLQHNADAAPIGVVQNAYLQDGNVMIEGVVYLDQMPTESANAFQREQLKGISTGHIMIDFEAENKETNERLTSKEFDEALQEAFEKDGIVGVFNFIDEYWMVHIELEWLENSVVSLPSNKSAQIVQKNWLEDYAKNKYGELTEDENDATENVETAEADVENAEPEPAAENEGETPETPVNGDADQAETPEPERNSINTLQVQYDALKLEHDKLRELATTMSKHLENVVEERNNLLRIAGNKRPLKISNQLSQAHTNETHNLVEQLRNIRLI